MIQIDRAKGFSSWLSSLTEKEQLKVEARLRNIKNFGHFGDIKPLGDGLAELRWANGWRVYLTKEHPYTIVLLLGGHKNGQKKDIEKAKILVRGHAYH